MERVRAGNRPFLPLDVLHRENLDDILPNFGLDHLGEEARDHATRFWHRLDPWPDIADGFRALRQTSYLCAHSNGNVALMMALSRHAGLGFDMILGAEICGAYKPMQKSYLNACRLLMRDPADVIMVAAHNDDLAAARACGLKTAFVPRPTEHGPGQATDLAPSDDWDYAAASMLELADLLAR